MLLTKWSFEVPRLCVRLHFFSQEPPSDDPIGVVDAMADQADSYLGFVTLRPIRVCPIAATILRPLGKDNSHFINSKDSFDVNLAGQKFVVNGTPFMQQDNAVGACAQASIWMALRTLRRKDWQSPYSPAQITSAATRYNVSHRTLPNRRGLNIEQISEALRSSGYAPHVLHIRIPGVSSTPESTQKAKRDIYPYIESGLPVMLGLFPRGEEGHAVVAIGHGWRKNPSQLLLNRQIAIQGQAATTLDIYDAASWVEPFFIHNDNTGPYVPLPEPRIDKYGYALPDVAFAFPFLQPDVFVDAEEAKYASLNILANLMTNFDYRGGTALRVSCLVTRTYLQSRSEFRAWVTRSTLPDQIKRHYRQKWLPKRIWVTEINEFDNYGQSPEGGSCRIGEILFDPASDPEDGAFLAVHLGEQLLPSTQSGGVLIDRNAFNGEINGDPVPAAQYSPFINT